MPAIARPRKTASSKPAVKTSHGLISPQNVSAELERHILVDGFKLVFDLEKSRGSRFVDAATGRELIDLYSFYASQPIGFNHPWFNNPNLDPKSAAFATITSQKNRPREMEIAVKLAF